MAKIYVSSMEDAAFESLLHGNNKDWEEESKPILFCQVYPIKEVLEDGDLDIDFDTELDYFVIHSDEVAEFLKLDESTIDWHEINTEKIFLNMKECGYLKDFISMPNNEIEIY